MIERLLDVERAYLLCCQLIFKAQQYMPQKDYRDLAVEPKEKSGEISAWDWICDLMPEATQEERVDALQNLDNYIRLLMRIAERQEAEEQEKVRNSKSSIPLSP